MKLANQTTEFILIGLSCDPGLRIPLFLLFMTMYGTTLLSNGGLIALIQADRRLWTPMYLLICQLSLVDLCYSTTVTPKMLVSFIVERNTISYYGCMAQLYSYTTLGGAESFLLAAMGYDRYVAICLPLQYPSIMTRNACTRLVMGCHVGAFVNASVHLSLMLRLSFCGSIEIQHFFCDFPPLLHLSCTETHINRIVLFVLPCMMGMFSILLIIISYASIFNTILSMRSNAGKLRAFSTCSSHFTAMTLFYGTAFFIYLRPSDSYFREQDMVVSVFYTVVIAMINPLIYSLRNQDIKKALKMALATKC
ncbi:olfactory receptor-like protein COR4 [Ambystoma mexicanum]|uniref:olfactory receptor-like protein COR4 n=1 Tax=Ambystoma mexicanum TaxID=8296 RepID=UPI0037E94C25